MLFKITRGIGGPKGILILSITAALGIVLIGGAFGLRHWWLKPKGVVVTTLPAAQGVMLGEKARGTSVEVTFVAGDRARVTAAAPARDVTNHWGTVVENSILKVTGVAIRKAETWVTGVVETELERPGVTVHASFLEPYKPVLLDRRVELSDVKLVTVRAGESPGTAVSGWLRNVTGAPIRQCIVACVFQDAKEAEVDLRRAAAVDLPVGQLVRFQTVRTPQPFASIALQIGYPVGNGLRDYLSMVVIQKSSLP